MGDYDAFEPNSTRLNFVASYPKSGNTWIRLTCAAYANRQGKEMADFAVQNDIDRWAYQCVSPIPVNELGPGGEVQLRPAAMLVIAHDLKGPTLVKSHHACIELNQYHLWNKQWARRVVVPVRDPRDVVCSLADHMGMTHEEAAEFMANPEATIGGEDQLHHILCSWSDHVSSWMETSRVPTHIVRYEDMHADTVGEMEEILQFLDVPIIDRARIEQAVEKTRFDRMSRIEDEQGFPEKSRKQEKFFRKGEAGGWTDELDPAIAERIVEDHGEMMERLGYL